MVMVEEGEAEYRKGVGVTLLKGRGEGLFAAGAGLWNDLAVGLMKAAGEGEALTGARVELWKMTGAGLDHLMTGGVGVLTGDILSDQSLEEEEEGNTWLCAQSGLSSCWLMWLVAHCSMGAQPWLPLPWG